MIIFVEQRTTGNNGFYLEDTKLKGSRFVNTSEYDVIVVGG
tara:strand:- start:22164 stop:22286 length:123 start_codon:yes stop_codon:yes gene_type:complete